MRNLRVIKIAAAILMLLPSYFGAQSVLAAQQGSPATIKLTDADNNRSIEAVVGQQIEIRLQANPTTGYLWLLQPFPQFLELSDFSYGRTGKSMPGSGGDQTVKLIVQSSGTGDVTFNYRRIWEKADTPPARTFAVKVTVH